MKDFASRSLASVCLACTIFFSNAQNNALSFDDVDDHITFASAPSFSGSGTMTFEAWIYPTTVTGFQTIAAWTDGGSNEARLSVANGFLDLFQTDGANSGSLRGSIAINANEWTHVAFVQTTGSIDFYVNGVQEIEGNPVGPAGASGTFTLGIYGGSLNPYGGLLDEVRIWDVALNQSTIQDRMFRILNGNESNLVAYYQFNETTGTVLPDLTANSYDGTLVNFPTPTDPSWQLSDALPKNALDFDGTNDYVDISAVSPDFLGAQNNFTVELWANLEPVFIGSRRGSVFSVNDGGGANLNRMLLYIHDGSDVGKENRIGVVDAGINPDFDIVGPVIADDTWHHIAYSRSGTTGTLYVDGLPIGTHTADFTFQSGDLWSLGQEFDGSATMSDFIDGQLDDVRIWNVARSESEIQTNMFSDLAGNEANLIAYYDFNQGFAGGTNTSFNTLIDRTSNSNDGSLGSFALTGVSSNWVASGAQVPAGEITVYNGLSNTDPEVLNGQPVPVNFGNALLATTKPLTLTIENNGFADLVITDITTTGDFSVTSSTAFTVTAGSTATFTVELLALSAGIANGNVTIQSNDPNELNFTFPVTGTKGTLLPKAYWTDETGTANDEIDRVDLSGANGQNAYYSGFSIDIKGIAVDAENNMVFWTNTDSEVRCGRIGPTGFTATNTVVDESGSGTQEFNGIDVDGAAGKVYWCDAFNGQVRRVNFDGSNKEVLVTKNGLRDIALDVRGGKMYYLANDTGTPEIWRANLDGTVQENIITKAGTTFRGLALDLVNSHIYWTENGNIQRANLDGTGEATMSTQLVDPGSIDIDVGNETFYVIDEANNAIVSINFVDDPLIIVQSGATVTNPQYLAIDTRTMTPLNVVSTTPVSNGGNIAAGTNIDITFDQQVDPFTIDNTTSFVTGDQTGPIAGTLSGGGTTDITFNPTSDFKVGERIQVTLTTDIKAMGGGLLSNDYFFEFFVSADPAPQIPPFLQEADVYNVFTNTGVDRVVAMDVNMDTFMDVVGIYEGIEDGIAWYQNDGSQQFTRQEIFNSAFGDSQSVAAADLDQDGDIDFLSAYAGVLNWYENDGSFSFTQIQINLSGVGHGLHDIRVVDMDGDGDMDIVGIYASGPFNLHQIVWNENDGNQNFTRHTFAADINLPLGLEVADVDKDGDVDILAGGSSGEVGWYENDGNQSFTSHTTTSSQTSQFSGFTVGDFNGNGNLDIAMNTTTETSWFVNDGSGNFTESVISATIGGNDLQAADLNGDGDTDLVAGSNGILRFFENDGAGNFTIRSTSSGANIEDVFVSDVDSDGDLDVIASGQGARVVWFENTIITNPEIGVFVGSDNTGTPITDAQVTMVDIGSAVETNDIVQTFAIENTGNGVLTITSIVSSATEYTISGAPTTVGVGATETFTLTLDGTTPGTFGTTITITNDDSDENPFTFPVTGEITGSNQPPGLSYVFYVDENTPNGTLIGAVVGTDPEGDPLTYSILSGNTGNAFAINSTNGNITVNDVTALDYETTPVFTLVVQTDDGNGGLTMVTITINLNDINENVLGVEDLKEQVSVYPNPADRILFIELEDLNTKDLDVRMYSVSGSEVLNKNHSSLKSDKRLELNLEQLNPGIYLLKIQHEAGILTKNILVK